MDDGRANEPHTRASQRRRWTPRWKRNDASQTRAESATEQSGQGEAPAQALAFLCLSATEQSGRPTRVGALNAFKARWSSED